jgi:hypothetical protein
MHPQSLLNARRDDSVRHPANAGSGPNQHRVFWLLAIGRRHESQPAATKAVPGRPLGDMANRARTVSDRRR